MAPADAGWRWQVKTLLWKELRQIPRQRAALASSVLLPLLFLMVLPAGHVSWLTRLSSSGLPSSGLPSSGLPDGISLPPTAQLLSRNPTEAFRLFTFPLLVLVAGLMGPLVMAVHIVVVERERRTLDLLVALPVSLSAIVSAKLLAIIIVAAGIALPLFAIDCIVGLRLGLVTLRDVASLLVLLLAALGYSTTVALVVSLLAGDFRTANNVSGALIGPLVLLAVPLTLALPPGMAPPLLAVALLVFAATALLAAFRWLTVERMIR